MAADLDVVRLARFLRRVEDGYLPNPYHNKTHAADVLQSQFMLLTAGGLARRAADPLILLAALLSAIIHDLDHKGVNNDFLIRQSHELAIVYNGAPGWSRRCHPHAWLRMQPTLISIHDEDRR